MNMSLQFSASSIGLPSQRKDTESPARQESSQHLLSFTQTDSQSQNEYNKPKLPKGYIKALTICNFKSYKGSTVIAPFHPFTCVIGPNGSGKSNLMDAISFVLGVRTQQLRGRKLADLIHRSGSFDHSDDPAKRRRRNQANNINEAFVELQYVHYGNNEPESGDDEEDRTEHELVFRRSIKRGNDGTVNQYNGKRMKFKEYIEKLGTIGVIVKARNFLVFQGDVTSIAQKTPKELTNWFEHISGSIEFKEEFENLLKEQEDIQNKFEGINERNRNLAREKKQMKAQRDEAQNYGEMKQELVDLQSEFYRYQLFNIFTDIQTANEEIDTIDRQMKTDNLEQKDCEDSIKLKQADLAKSLRTKNNKTKLLKKLQQSLSKKKLKKDALSKELNLLKKRKTKIITKLDKCNEENGANENEIKELQSDMNECKEEKEEYLQEMKDDSDDIELEQSQYEEYKEIKDKVRAETAELTRVSHNFENEWHQKKDILGNVENEIKALHEREQRLQSNITGIENDVTLIENDEKVSKSDLEKYRKLVRVKNAKVAKCEERKDGINKELSVIQLNLQELTVGMNENKYETEKREILKTLQKLFNGIYGRLSDLIEIRQKKKHAMAVSVGLGINFDSIVVEDRSVAMQCMDHMRKTRRGHFRFIPLNDIRANDVGQQFRRSLSGSSTPIIDVIDYEKHLERAVLYALSNTVVVDTIEEARAIAYKSNNNRNNNGNVYRTQKIRLVCLDGTLIAPNGNISGGHSKSFRDKSRRFNEKELDKKKDKRDELIQELRQIEYELDYGDDSDNEEDGEGRSSDELQKLIDDMEQRINTNAVKLKTFGDQLSAKTAQIKEVKKTLKAQRKECKKARKMEVEAGDKYKERDGLVKERENEIFGEFCEAIGIDNIQDFEAQKMVKVEERAKKMRHFEGRLQELRNNLEYLESKQAKYGGDIEKQMKEIKKIDKDIRSNEKGELKKLVKVIDEEEVNCKDAEDENDEIQEKVKEKRKTVMNEKKRIDDIRQTISKLQKQGNDLEAWIEKMKQTQINVMEQAKRSSIDLKKSKKVTKKGKATKGGGGVGHRRKRRRRNDGASSDEAESDYKSDDNDLSGNGDDSGDSDGDVAMDMEEELKNIDYSEFEKDGGDGDQYERKKKEYQIQIDDVQQKLGALAPNMKALEQFGKITKKWKDGNNEQRNWRKKATKMVRDVDDVTKRRNEKFKECFDVVKKNIAVIYKELTKSKQYRNGGRAYLDHGGSSDLFNSEINFSAMPPGKPYREMVQLSGGEKSVASLALLFAIHSFKPSPFFILDEVDAALDTNNVHKVSEFIKMKAHRDNTQMIVISLKDKFFAKADALVGVCKDRSSDSSQLLCIDLAKFANQNGSGDDERDS